MAHKLCLDGATFGGEQMLNMLSEVNFVFLPVTWVDFPKCSVPFAGQSPWSVISHGLLHDVAFYLVRFTSV